MDRLAVYLHGQGGSAEEAEHYRPLLRDFDVIGFDYGARAPWDAQREFPAFFGPPRERYRSVTLIGNSLGAYFAMCAGIDRLIDRALLISPIADMQALILGRMAQAGVTEDRLQNEKTIAVPDAEPLSWEYLRYAKSRPIAWNVPTEILYGERDFLTPPEVMAAFAGRIGAGLTVMEGGEHWFHTAEQMRFLDRWLTKSI